jgi:hypothetical protein
LGCCFVDEWEGVVDCGGVALLPFSEVLGIAECLFVDFGEGYAVFFRFDYPDDFGVDVEEVVGVSAVAHGDFADCDSWSCAEVDVVAVLDDPACEFKVFVDDEACPLFGGESAWLGHSFNLLPSELNVRKMKFDRAQMPAEIRSAFLDSRFDCETVQGVVSAKSWRCILLVFHRARSRKRRRHGNNIWLCAIRIGCHAIPGFELPFSPTS